jgi:hypothetical protein
LRSKLDFAKSTTSNGVDLFTVDLEVLAEHMTMVDQLFFQSLSVRDFFHQLSKKQASHPIALWISHCNQLSQWFCNAIVAKQGAKSRTSLIDRFLKLGALLWEMGNFSSAITIYLTLSLQSVSLCCKDLDKTAPLGKRFEQLAEKIRPLKNFAGYREALKSHSGPSIPYIAIIMKDIVVLEETSVIHQEAGPNCWKIRGLNALDDVLETQFLLPQSKKYHFEIDQSIFSEILKPGKFAPILAEKKASGDSPDWNESQPRIEAIVPKLVSNHQADSRTAVTFNRNVKSGSGRIFSVDKDSAPIWKDHSSLCLSQLNMASTRDPQRTDAFSELSSIFSSNVARYSDDSSRPNPTINHAGESVPECIKYFVTVLSRLPLTFAGWSSAELPTPIENRMIASDTLWKLKALVVETALALAHTLRGSGARVSDGLVSVMRSSVSEDCGIFSFNIGFSGSEATDTSTAEEAVLALLSPTSGLNFILLRGRVSISRSPKISSRIVAQLHLSCPLH